MMSGTVFDAMVDFFDQDNWRYQRLPDEPIISLGYSGENGSFQCYARAREEQVQFIFYSICSAKAPLHRRQAMAEFITRANYGLIIGNFEMDFNDGEIRYKTSVDVDGAELTFALARHIVYANVITMDRYLPGIMRVLYADIPPAQAIAEVEGDAPPPGSTPDDDSDDPDSPASLNGFMPE